MRPSWKARSTSASPRYGRPPRPTWTNWPDFGTAGKADITVRQVLGNAAGLPVIPGHRGFVDADHPDFGAHEEIQRRLAAAAITAEARREQWSPNDPDTLVGQAFLATERGSILDPDVVSAGAGTGDALVTARGLAAMYAVAEDQSGGVICVSDQSGTTAAPA